MKFELIKFGDKNGVGCIVKRSNILGVKSTWTVHPDDAEHSAFREWVCIETGQTLCANFRRGRMIDNFYTANYNTQSKTQ